MRILLVSRNRVVQELVKLALKDIEALELEILDRVESPRYEQYDLILEEDNQVLERHNLDLKKIESSKRILLGDKDRIKKGNYDYIVAKPFLPSDIRRAIDKSKSLDSKTQRVLSKDQEAKPQIETEILDRDEIMLIRRLLEDEIDADKPFQEMEQDSRITLDIEEFLKLLKECKVKKLRQLLKGARLNIEIEFPEDMR